MIPQKSIAQTELHFEATLHPSHVPFDHGKELRRNIPSQHSVATRWAWGDRRFTPKDSRASTAIGVDELHQIRGVRYIERLPEVRWNGLHKRKTPMKNNYVSQALHASEPATQSAVGRFQVYRESRGENSMSWFSTDSVVEAVKASMVQALAFDGGDFRILPQTDQRTVAFIEIIF
ncbi:MAG: hypothetical protein ABI273_05710 [Lacunisphaera sp.]